jgi:lipid-A-disaccharide synthase
MLATLKELAIAGMAVEARVLIAPALDGATRSWLAARAAQAGVRTIDTDAEGGAVAWLSAFDASLTASGTATLECALAGAAPVVVYRLSALTSAIARRIVRTPFIGLPNIVLGSSVYPELLDRDVEPRRMARALGAVLERRATFESPVQELRARLAWSTPATRGEPPALPVGDTMADRTASLLSTWLSSRACPRSRDVRGVWPPSRASEVSIPP